MSSDSLDDRLKYSYVSRKNYDYHQDRIAKKFDGVLQRLAVVENYSSALEDAIHALEAEIEGIRLDKTSVRIAGRREASERRD